MAKSKSTIRFWLRMDKLSTTGTYPINIVYQINGQRKFYWLPDIRLYEINWDKPSQKAVYIDKKVAKKEAPAIPYSKLLTKIEADEINDKLDEKAREIKNIEKKFELDGVVITPQNVVDALKNGNPSTTDKVEAGNRIVDFIKRYSKESATTHKFRTLQVYLGLATHLDDYERKYGHVATFETIDIPFLRGFVTYLTEPKSITIAEDKVRKVEGMNNVTIAKQISTLKTLLKAARSLYHYQVNQAYLDFKIQRKDAGFEVVTLTAEEFEKLFYMDLSGNKSHDQVRDVFCFACATGLRYSDLVQLKRDHIRHDVIRMTAAKTGQRLEIPLNPYSFAILEKYKNRLSPLPIISGQKTNDYLKKIGEAAEIDSPVEKVREKGIKKEIVSYKKYELMSIHMGRRTFTTLSLEKGMAPQEVMALTGHTTYKAFKRYVDVTNDRKKTVMAQAWGEVKVNNLKSA